MIFNVSEIDKIDFDEVCETSKETMRYSVDGQKTLVKWDGEEIPECVLSLNTKEGAYTHEEILEIMSTNEWTNTNEENL